MRLFALSILLLFLVGCNEEGVSELDSFQGDWYATKTIYRYYVNDEESIEERDTTHYSFSECFEGFRFSRDTMYNFKYDQQDSSVQIKSADGLHKVGTEYYQWLTDENGVNVGEHIIGELERIDSLLLLRERRIVPLWDTATNTIIPSDSTFYQVFEHYLAPTTLPLSWWIIK